MNEEPSKLDVGGGSSVRLEPSRRDLLIAMGGLLVLSAAGCGAGGSRNRGARDEESTSEGTRTVKHKYGTTEIC